MLHYVYASDLPQVPRLARTMFQDRAKQFRDRLGWDVDVNDQGYERDEYDDLNPLYVIWEQADGTHGGSMRFLPTTGRTMVAEHFSHLTGGVVVESPLIWECTRFCLAPGAVPKVAAGLILAAGEIMDSFHLRHFIGVFDSRMPRIYRRYGLEPDVIGESGEGSEKVSVGLWKMDDAAWGPTLSRLDIDRQTSHEWLMNSLAVRPKSPAPVQ